MFIEVKQENTAPGYMPKASSATNSWQPILSESVLLSYYNYVIILLYCFEYVLQAGMLKIIFLVLYNIIVSC